ncbi:MAG: response regulator transcription factor, partial [Clostridia bacterium]|nr:response regulator transcription factor [Clostridia bacterium]
DVMLPGMDGFHVLRRIRAEGLKTPVCMLTARAGLEDRVQGLESGADYYLPKPFQMVELAACLRAITRRREEAPVMRLTFGDVELNQGESKLICAATGHSVKLGAKEFQLMELLLRNPRQILPKEVIIERIWGYDSEAEYNNLEVYVSFVRKKLAFVGSTLKIRAARGVGYALEEAT